MISEFKNLVRRLHACEKGEIPVGPIMVIGLIVIPIIIALVLFRDDLMQWFDARFGEFKGQTTTTGP